MSHEMLFLTAIIGFLGMISPGPDFFMVLKSSLSYSRKIALTTCLGIILAIMVHISYCVAGVAILITKTPWIYNILRYIGAIYLVYLGIMALKVKSSGENFVMQQKAKQTISYKTAFSQGFFCNLLNPKATMFFLAIFTQVLNENSSLGDKLLVSLIIMVEAVIWWPIVVFIFQSTIIQRRYYKLQGIIDKLLGLVLILLGIKVAL